MLEDNYDPGAIARLKAAIAAFTERQVHGYLIAAFDPDGNLDVISNGDQGGQLAIWHQAWHLITGEGHCDPEETGVVPLANLDVTDEEGAMRAEVARLVSLPGVKSYAVIGLHVMPGGREGMVAAHTNLQAEELLSLAARAAELLARQPAVAIPDDLSGLT